MKEDSLNLDQETAAVVADAIAMFFESSEWRSLFKRLEGIEKEVKGISRHLCIQSYSHPGWMNGGG